jgi:hypothetical protein
MGLNPSIIPADSALRDWITALSIAETPVSYQVLTGLACIGAALKRSCYIYSGNWNVYPTVSILLVGPSGIGKDTAINEAEKVLKLIGHPRVYGTTSEALTDQMLGLGDPAACYIPAPEISALCGSKDYQTGIIQVLTDVLSQKETHDCSTKSNKNQIITRPTVTMMAGSTEEWLHKSMPEGSLEGGWWPRFLISCEEYGSRFVALPGYRPKEDLQEAFLAKNRFYSFMLELVAEYSSTRRSREIVILEDARYFYENWYQNRHSYFSKTVRPYAERSRDSLLRLSLLMAISRGRSYVELSDMWFARDLLAFIAARIDNAVQPPNLIAQIGKQILLLVPCDHKAIAKALSRRFDPGLVKRAQDSLLEQGLLSLDKETKVYSKGSS